MDVKCCVLCFPCLDEQLDDCSVELKAGDCRPACSPVWAQNLCDALPAKDSLACLQGTFSLLPFWGFKLPAHPL